MEDEHKRLADDLEQEADSLQRPSSEMKEDLSDQRDDWDQKTKAEAVPGAMELPDEEPDVEEIQEKRFEYEERAPETAEAKGPAGVETRDDEGDDSDDDSDEDS